MCFYVLSVQQAITEDHGNILAESKPDQKSASPWTEVKEHLLFLTIINTNDASRS